MLLLLLLAVLLILAVTLLVDVGTIGFYDVVTDFMVFLLLM